MNQVLRDVHRIVAALELEHLNWPAENPGPKPTLEEYLSEETLAMRAEEPLRMSGALEALYFDPITPDQLQAELKREAEATKMPERLRELWSALGNDPALIAEVVARPILAENRLRARYYADESIHGDLKAHALEELSGLTDAHDLRSLSGTYHEVEYRRIPDNKENTGRLEEERRGIVWREPELWREELQTLGDTFGRSFVQSPSDLSGAVSGLKDGGEHYYVQTVVDAGPDRVRVGTMVWRKTPFTLWWNKARDHYPAEKNGLDAMEFYDLSLPAIPQKMRSGLEGWEAISTTGAPAGRTGFACVWTGTVMIVWGGGNGSGLLNSGGRYNPATDSWASTSTSSAPSARSASQAVWTGSEMIVWGNTGDPANRTGGRYNPVSNSWTATSTGTNCPTGRELFSMVWTGTDAVVWGGDDGSYFPVDTGGRYNPTTDSWEVVGNVGAPYPRAEHCATWDTNDKMIIWGGWAGSGLYLDTGGRHNGTDLWISATPTSGAPEPRMWPTMVRRLYGGAQIVWGGMKASSPYNSLNTGARLDVSAGTWTPTSTTNAPSGRHNHSAVWSHNAQEMVVWGGYTDASPYQTNTGGRYSLDTDSWTPMPTDGAPTARELHRAIEIGEAGVHMIVWGGRDSGFNYPTAGGSYGVCSTFSPSLQSSPVTAADLDSCSQGIRITWKDAFRWYDSGYGTRSFEIYRNGTLLATRSYTGATTNAYIDYTTVAGTTYTYYVRYNSGCGYSTNSGTVTASDTITGSAPSGLTAPTVAVDTLLCQRNKLTVSWTRDPASWNDTGGLFDREYQIWVDGIQLDAHPYDMNITSMDYYLDPTNVTHSVTVVYRNACGFFSAHTPAAQGMDYEKETPIVPPITAADASGCADTGVTVTWPAEATDWGDHGATNGTRGYSVYRDGTGIALGLAYGTTSYTDTGGTNGTSYNYSVRYYNACGEYATTTAAAADNLPSVPSSLTNNTAADLSVCADTGVLVTWTADPGSWGDSDTGTRTYTVLRNGAAIPSGGCSGNKAYGTVNCTDITGTNGTSYTYTVRYNNGCGQSATTAGAAATDQAPTTPTAANNSAADVSVCDDSGVSVTWSAPSSWNDNGSGTRTIDVLRGGTAIATGLAATATSHTDTTGTNGTSYLYQVRFNNGCSISTTTSGASATDSVSTTPTAANNSAADVSVCDDSGVSVTWSAPSSWNDNGSGTRTIDVLRGGTAIATGLAATATSHTDTTGTNGTSYLYQVRFNNGCSISTTTSGASATDSVSTTPTAANNSAADVSVCDDSGVSVTWSAPSSWNDNGSGTRTIDVLRGGTAIATGLAATATSHTDTTGTNGTSYLYQVRFNNGCSISTTTSGASATDSVSTTPTAANNSAADVSVCDDSGVSVTWSAPSSWNDNGSGTRTIDVLRGGTAIATGLAATATSHTDTTGTNGTSYLYQVRFNNGCSFSTTTIGASAADMVGGVATKMPVNPHDESACSYSGVRIDWPAEPTDWGDNGVNPSGRKYQVIRGLNCTTTSPISDWIPYGSPATILDTTAAPDVSYCYGVYYVNGCGNGRYGYADYGADTRDTAPCGEVGSTLDIVKSGMDASLTWEEVTCGDLAGYQVYGTTSYGASFPSEWTLLGSLASTGASDPLASSFVAYRVVTVDLCGNVSP